MESPSLKENKSIQLEPGWKNELSSEFQQPYFQQLRAFLKTEKEAFTIYPKGDQIFRAFDTTPFDKLKVVLIGQDPYHGAGQAEGLSFSVAPGIKPPPSLINIYKELREDVGFQFPNHGHLLHWAIQGVLMLNSVLTVRANQPASHRNKGWEKFTDAAIQKASQHKEHLVFLLWGKYAQEKEILIDANKHLILKAAHPSPYSAAAGFFGCKHFSKTNAYLIKNGIEPIQWQLPLS